MSEWRMCTMMLKLVGDMNKFSLLSWWLPYWAMPVVHSLSRLLVSIHWCTLPRSRTTFLYSYQTNEALPSSWNAYQGLLKQSSATISEKVQRWQIKLSSCESRIEHRHPVQCFCLNSRYNLLPSQYGSEGTLVVDPRTRSSYSIAVTLTDSSDIDA